MEEKTIIFDGGGANAANSSMMGLLSGLLGKNNLDPNLVAALMNNRNQDGMMGGNWIWIILLFFLFGRRGFGGDGESIPAQLNNDAGRELLMNAIQGNGNAIGQLASSLNVSTTALQNAICGVNNTLTQLGGQVGMSTQQVINAIQSGNCQLGNAITTQGYENRLAECNQTNTLVNTMNANNQAVIGRIDAFEHSQLQERIASLRERNLELQNEISQRDQNAVIGGMIAPINARLAAIECHQLPTYPQAFVPGFPVSPYAAPAPFYGGCDPCHGKW